MFKKLINNLSFILVFKVLSSKIFKILPDYLIINIQYFLIFGKFPDLKKPKKFSEKIQWIKLYGHLEKYGKYVDKYEVRNYVKKTVGSKYLIPFVGVWNKIEDVEFGKLPDKFVIKATHGASYNYICKDKSLISVTYLKKLFNKWQKENFYDKTREKQYKSIKSRIICEKYMENYENVLIDYKFLCFNGSPKLIDVHIDRFIDHRSFYMDLKWKKKPIQVDFEPDVPSVLPEKPTNLKEMISIAKKLAADFPFVRVDLYSIKGKTYFGELTFTPANGLLRFKDSRTDYLLGIEFNIDKYIL